MKNPDANSEFIRNYYGSVAAFRAAVREDYCKVQLTWTCYIDGLCEAGIITQHQRDTWAFPGRKPRKHY